MDKYHILSRKGEGTFAEVVKAQNTENGNYYAIKCMKSSFKNIEKVNALREVQALKRLAPHPHIVLMEEVLFDEKTGRLALVFELMDSNLYELIKGRKKPLAMSLIKSYGYQMMNALSYIHGRGVFHRDIKPENILVAEGGKILKLADFGSVRGIHSKPPYTEYISTRWYRAPECLLTDGHYGPKMDVWGAGCVLYEIVVMKPLFPGKDEMDQINRIHKVLGSPSLKDWMNMKKTGSRHTMNLNFSQHKGTGFVQDMTAAPEDLLSLVTSMLVYGEEERITAVEAFSHKFFETIASSRGGSKGSTSISSASKNTQAPQSEKSTAASRVSRVIPLVSSQAESKKKSTKQTNTTKKQAMENFSTKSSPKKSISEKESLSPQNSHAPQNKNLELVTLKEHDSAQKLGNKKDVTKQKKKIELPKIRGVLGAKASYRKVAELTESTPAKPNKLIKEPLFLDATNATPQRKAHVPLHQQGTKSKTSTILPDIEVTSNRADRILRAQAAQNEDGTKESMPKVSLFAKRRQKQMKVGIDKPEAPNSLKKVQGGK